MKHAVLLLSLIHISFAYQIDGGQFGKVTSDKDIKVESETSSIIVLDVYKRQLYR